MHIIIIINKNWSVINENYILVSSVSSSRVFKCSKGHVADLVLESRVPVENLPRLRVEPDHEYVVTLVAELEIGLQLIQIYKYT